MPSVLSTVKLQGFTSATTSVAPTGGTALGTLSTVNVMDDGGITFTDAGGNKRVMGYSQELHALLELITVGASGVSTTKKWHSR